MADPPLITVFTPTYNRAHTLHRVFDSLRAQTFRDFEWLVVDDGSTDGTAELIARWAKAADFPVRYVQQDHAGKHIAHNRALGEARGYFFFPIDSDDAFMPDAFEKMVRLWNTIPHGERRGFCSIGALCRDQTSKVVGDKFSAEPFDASLRDVLYVHRVRGEKWIGWVTEIMRRYPFPEVAGTQFIPEGIIILDIAKTYKGRWSNDVVRIYYVNDAETGPTLSQRASLGEDAAGRWLYYVWLLNNDLEYFSRSPMPFVKAAVMLPVVGWFSGQSSFWHALKALRGYWAKLLVLLAFPFASLLYVSARFQTGRISSAKTARS